MFTNPSISFSVDLLREKKFHCLSAACTVDFFHVLKRMATFHLVVRSRSVEVFRLEGWLVTSVEDTFGVIRVLAVAHRVS